MLHLLENILLRLFSEAYRALLKQLTKTTSETRPKPIIKQETSPLLINSQVKTRPVIIEIETNPKAPNSHVLHLRSLVRFVKLINPSESMPIKISQLTKPKTPRTAKTSPITSG
jgi:hypothetical protein